MSQTSNGVEERIRNAVSAALADLGAAGIEFTVERPGELSHGDYATNAAFAASIVLKKPPKEVAEAIATRLRDVLGETAVISVAGPGFVNFTLSPSAVGQEIARAVREGSAWGKGNANTGKRIMVEYTDPNPFKEMHIGHLMSNAIGESVARLIEFSGAVVSRANYEGDVGPHVAKAIWGLRDVGVTEPGNAAELGKAYAHGARAYEESETAKAEIEALNRAIYKGGDHELMELWRKGRDVSLSVFEDIYRVLGTKFDYYFFESETAPVGTRIVLAELSKGIFEESDGAVVYRGEKKGLHTRVFLTSQKTPTYEAKELGLAVLKEERWPSDRSIILTAAEQTGHFSVVLEAMKEALPLLGAKTEHISHGFLRLVGGKMSSREGNVITIMSLIHDVTMKVSEKNSDPIVAGQVALGAIKYSILRQSSGSDIIFDTEKSLSLEGDSGPYLQYALVRARKILAYAQGKGGTGVPEKPYDIERIILHFPEVVARAAREKAPHHVAQYLTELAAAWNSFYASEQVLGSPEEAYKMNVTKAFAATMENGLRLLGIPAPERM